MSCAIRAGNRPALLFMPWIIISKNSANTITFARLFVEKSSRFAPLPSAPTQSGLTWQIRFARFFYQQALDLAPGADFTLLIYKHSLLKTKFSHAGQKERPAQTGAPRCGHALSLRFFGGADVFCMRAFVLSG
jgi:hypothetical protein